MPTTLTNEEIQRFSRHLILPEVGMDGQIKLKDAKETFATNSSVIRRTNK